jgi:hypothetical protein
VKPRCAAEWPDELPRRVASLVVSPVVRMQDYSKIPQRTQPDHSTQQTLYVSTIQDVGFGVEVARTERCVRKTKVLLLGNHITTADAALFAICMVVKDLTSILVWADHFFVEIVTGSRLGLTTD